MLAPPWDVVVVVAAVLVAAAVSMEAWSFALAEEFRFLPSIPLAGASSNYWCFALAPPPSRAVAGPDVVAGGVGIGSCRSRILHVTYYART